MARRSSPKSVKRIEVPPPPPGWNEAQGLVRVVGEEITALLAEFPDAPKAPAVCAALESIRETLGLARKEAIEEREKRRRQALADANDALLRDFVADLRSREIVWSWEEASEALQLSGPMLDEAIKLKMLTVPPIPDALAGAWKRNTGLHNNLFEMRERLTEEEQAALLVQSFKVTMSAEDAADELGVSVGTFRKWVKDADIRPGDYHVTRSGWTMNLYHLGSIEILRFSKTHSGQLAKIAARQKAERAKLVPIWHSLNERQRIYLRAVYREHQAQEDAYRSGYLTPGMTMNGKLEGGEWRWLHHNEVGLDSGIRGRLEGIDEDLIDSGTGSTYAALDERGLLERANQSEEFTNYMGQVRTVSVLWVKLTLTGRRLAAAAIDYPEEFPAA